MFGAAIDKCYEAKYFTGKSFSDISVGKHLTLKKSAPRPTSNGKFEVTIQDIPSFDFFSISSRVGYLGSTSYNRNAGTVKLTTFTYPDVSTFIVTASDGTTPRHKVVKNVQPDDTYIVSLDDMDPFDEEVAFSFPETDDVYLEVEASDSAPGTPNNYLVMSRYIRESGTTLSAWYTDELTNYRTYLTIRYPEYTYRYKSIGSIPSASVTWPQYSNFNIADQSFIGYSAVANEQYVWRSSSFEYDDDVTRVYGSWEISAASGKNLINEIPAEVINKYPEFTFDKLQHKSTTFYTKSPAFDSIVNNQFEGASEPDGLQVGLFISTETE